MAANPVEPDLALPASRNLLWNLLRNPVEPDPALHQSLADLLQNLLRNPVAPDLALHQSLPDLLRNLLWNPVEPDPAAPKPPTPSPEHSLEPSPEPLLNLTWLCTKASPTPRLPGTFSRTLLNLTWLCTKASPTFSGTFSGILLSLTWLCTKASWNLLRNLLRNPIELNLASWNLLRNLLRNPVELDLALHRSLPDLLRNLRNPLRNLVEPDPAPAPVHTGASLAEDLISLCCWGTIPKTSKDNAWEDVWQEWLARRCRHPLNHHLS